ncbi:MAG: Valyl-tRNA synthetase [Gemmatimonadetes bacterium]|nr:Valyl-tRNA synthetase [Gemmatimonadota bacterium]
MTSPPPLPDRYDFAATEPEIYRAWLDAGCFDAHAEHSSRVGGERQPYTIVMPPPNVTAILHVGHGLNNTIQDVIVRWARMRGAEALWVPGTDHAGIATQNVVEKLVAAEGKTRFDLGRAAFVQRTEEFVARTGGTILEQLRAIGASADWSRTAYTLSPELSVAVREAFVRLYERGLIYRGHRVIHWCPRCLTSLSDEEAEFNDETGKLYHIGYPVEGQPGRELVIATTRPETMLGDVALAVNPDDERYRDLIGHSVRLPIVNRSIPVIADAYADPTFGTGVVKITPAHDANDFEVGRRHSLPMPVVIDETGKLGEIADADGRVPAELNGMDRFEARERIVEILRTSGELKKIETHQHAVRHCYRCDTVVEPRLSDQWFVKMEPLARPALQAVRDGAIRILPERWEAVYVNWLTNIRDWNISRQLWWGHRVPVWYCDECDPPQDIIVSRDDVRECPHCGCPVRQDEDVLDTWFSSGLWPLSTLGWPDEQSADLAAFYPTDTLVTAPEILFFWVARMIMLGYEFTGRAPYHTVYLHGTARDTQHRKMSKSLGNGIDPLDVTKLYGADALRWTLIAGMGMGADVVLDPEDLDKSFAAGRNFGTKLWNIGRFLLDRVGSDPVQPLAAVDRGALTRADEWILSRLDAAIAECDRALGPLWPTTPHDSPDGLVWRESERYAGLKLNEYAEAARHFVWNELADWYLESLKSRLETPGADREAARAVLVHAFDQALRMLHPVVPFVTESLWQRLPGRAAGEFLVRASWPAARGAKQSRAAQEFEQVREVVLAVRQIRGDNAVAPGKMIEVLVRPSGADGGELRTLLEQELATIGRLTRSETRIVDDVPEGAAAHAVIGGGTEVIVPLAGLIDVEKECARLRGEVAELEKQILSREGRLNNAKYVERAPEQVVANDRAILQEMKTKREQLVDKVRSLCGA